ncbi:MAG: MerR family transcriptional regulator [Caldilineales bacterium]|nr:MerR family transcriptional regulator [Caldilineales bacterium]
MTSPAAETPTFNLKAVVQETGLKPDTLRAWERRYGLPSPARSSGKHRLYSQRDIDIIKWLITRQDEGLTISRAVDLWHKLAGEGQDPLKAVPTAPPPPRAIAPAQAAGGALPDLATAWMEACLAFDETRGENILSQAFALYSPETVALDIIRPAIVQIGEGWHAGHVTAQQEHFASALALRRLDAMVAAAPQPFRTQRILVGCPPEELHTFSPMLITFLLRRHGWPTLFLGANVPLTRFSQTIQQVRPQLVILSAQLLHTAATLLDMAEMLQKEGIPLAFGGLVFSDIPELAARIPGHYLGDTLDNAVTRIEHLLAHPTPAGATPPTSPAMIEALRHFEEQRPLIGARVWQILKPNGGHISPAHLTIANTHLGQNIAAALRLGDMSFLSHDLSWIDALLAERDLPTAALRHYLRAYAQAASAHLDARAAAVLDWFDTLLS